MRFVLAVIGVLLLSFSINGCFVIGTAIGSSVAKKRNAERPVIHPELEAINELEVGTWVDLVRNDGKIIEGKYVAVNDDPIPLIKLKMPGRRANQMIELHDIDSIVVGHKSDSPKFAGTLLGVVVDGIFWTIIAVAINKAISP